MALSVEHHQEGQAEETFLSVARVWGVFSSVFWALLATFMSGLESPGLLKIRSQLDIADGNMLCLEQWMLSFQSYRCPQMKFINMASIWFTKTQTSVGMFWEQEKQCVLKGSGTKDSFTEELGSFRNAQAHRRMPAWQSGEGLPPAHRDTRPLLPWS